MKMSVSLHRLLSWMTIAAILAALWSGMAHAQPGNAAPWNEICSASQQDAPQKSRHDAHVQHCAFCGKQDFAHVLPSRIDLPLAAARTVIRVTPVPALAMHTAPVWLASQPRGPPARRA